MKISTIKRGQIYQANLSPYKGSEQGGIRPVLILQNDRGNERSPTTIIAPITSTQGKKLPVHVELHSYCVTPGSIVLLEQLRVIDKSRIIRYKGSLYLHEMDKVDKALIKSVGLEGYYD
jgi:mRNA interferase MazF